MGPIYIYFIALSFIASFWIYKVRTNQFYLKLFPTFLGITLCIESFAMYLREKGQANYAFYSIFSSLEFAFYLFVLSCIINNKLTRKIIRYILVIYFLVSLSNILFIQKDTFNSITYSMGCLLVVFFCIYYFLELFRNPKSIKLVNEPAFWISSGLLFYYCCTFPLLGLSSLLGTMPVVSLNTALTLLYIMNVLLYTSFIIAFLCRKKTPKYISS